MELSLIGLQAAGKTSLVNVIATGSFQDNMIPTVGFNMRKVTKGSVVIKLWDLGGQVSQAPLLIGLRNCIDAIELTEAAQPAVSPLRFFWRLVLPVLSLYIFQ